MSEPQITEQAYHTSSGSNYPVHRVVIHTTEFGTGFPAPSKAGQAHAVAGYFTQASSGGSAHYVIDVANEEHCVHDNAIAWHAPPNQGSIGIEVCGRAAYTKDQWLSEDLKPMLDLVARRAADLCHRYDLPVVKLSVADLLSGKRGLCGHRDVSQAWHQSDHTDPGVNFPWGHFLDLVKGHLSQPTPSKPQPQAVPKFPGRILQLGVHGSDVHTWQAGMNQHHGAHLLVDGQYGPKSVAACKSLQKADHLTVDGKVGPKTWAATFKE